ncbi:hypothetical protein TL16_g12988 [Triparma laevis f. inornata]|uniref:Uncharacterized protein n=1 Tax=Triparma laevis f. inornata TaxID=1714386 RepID=A0A9W7BQP8_9STRA|nr:hypothetical protein TL16_g12988 [Triparma laevis f. inornata]
MGAIFATPKDSTAMGVAKVRLIKTLFPPDSKLFSDLYASYCCPGEFIMKLMGAQKLEGMFDNFVPGMYGMLYLRTKWLDDITLKSVGEKTFDDPVEICGRAWGDEKEVARKVDVFKKRVERSGEPWISGYTKEEMKGVLEEKGWKVEGDVCMSEMIEGGKFERGAETEGERRYMHHGRQYCNLIFAGAQITATLPSIIPAMALPENVKEAMKAASFLNVDMFNMVSVGRWTGGINYYDKTPTTTLVVNMLCRALLAIGVLAKKFRSRCFTAAIAITFLVLPTITTSVFALFPCESLDNGSSMLRKDYIIICDEGGRGFLVFYGWFIVLVFPIGVVAMYGWLLRSKRERLKKPVEERLEDEEITTLTMFKKKGSGKKGDRKVSSFRSSLSKHDNVWVEHVYGTGEDAGQTYYHQLSIGETVWERLKGEIRPASLQVDEKWLQAGHDNGDKYKIPNVSPPSRPPRTAGLKNL